jgi:hypothetical protein
MELGDVGATSICSTINTDVFDLLPMCTFGFKSENSFNQIEDRLDCDGRLLDADEVRKKISKGRV